MSVTTENSLFPNPVLLNTSVQRFSEVPDQSGMSILSVTPGNPVTLSFHNGKCQFGDCKIVPLVPNPVLLKTSV